jgi:hypothetical protein
MPHDQATGDPGPPRLLAQVRAQLRLLHYAIRTVEAYVDWFRRFLLTGKADIRLRGKPSKQTPTLLRGTGEFIRNMHDAIDRRVSPSGACPPLVGLRNERGAPSGSQAKGRTVMIGPVVCEANCVATVRTREQSE